ncbi:MAG: YHS domain-containing protein, partial [Nitrosospira sp.]
MTETKQAGSGCCGGAVKAPQDKSDLIPEKAESSGGCGCGDKAAASSLTEKPVATEKAAGGCCGGAKSAPNDPTGGHNGHDHAPTGTQIDPVCGMSVDPATTPHHHEHQGKQYSFCSAGCAAKFVANPDKYLNVQKAAPAVIAEGAIYTCPMHPQIRQIGPGACPICGMALEPVEITAEVGENAELTDMSRRFWVGLALALPVLILEMGSHIPALGLHNLVP